MTAIDVYISGLGFILYSPFAAAHIPPGSDFLGTSFWEPGDVARFVNSCRIATFCTGTPGDFALRLHAGPPEQTTLESAEFTVRMGLEVRDQTVCIRDLYDMLQWSPECPPSQQVFMPDGFYRVTVASSYLPAPTPVAQVIHIWFEAVPERPAIHHIGVPMLCPADD